MNQSGLKTTLTHIRRQRATLAQVRAEAEDLEDYLTVLESRARDTGERIPMVAVHRRLAAGRKAGSRTGR